jgi:TnsA endonuclease N terminal/TnsA endonuclease C terminal
VPDQNANSCDCIETIRSVRAVPRSHRSITGHFSSRLGDSIEFESTLERDFLVKHDFDLSVQKIVSQPCRVPYVQASGRRGRYTPDFLVIYRQHLDYQCSQAETRPVAMLVEVKPREDWRKHWRKWSLKWMAARRYALERGWIFRIMDESRIRDEQLSNINFLHRYRRTSVPAELCERVVRGLAALGPSTVDLVLSRHLEGRTESDALALVWHMVATRRIDADVSKPLNKNTLLAVSNV